MNARYVTVTPLAPDGSGLPPVQIEVTQFWYLNCMPVELKGTCQLPTGKTVVQLCADGQTYCISGSDYWNLVHGDKRVTKEYTGLLEATFHFETEKPRSLIVANAEAFIKKR